MKPKQGGAHILRPGPLCDKASGASTFFHGLFIALELLTASPENIPCNQAVQWDQYGRRKVVFRREIQEESNWEPSFPHLSRLRAGRLRA
jgi:hypothetical protein